MARPLRLEYPGALYHITSRGNARQEICLDDRDRRIFLNTLGEVIKQFNWICHAYCLMDNHYHLLIETPDGNLSRGMRHLNGVYTQKFNARHERVGHLLQGRFKGILVEKESYLLELSRYIVLNPVRAKMAADPAEYPWSSFRSTIGIEPCPYFLKYDWLLEKFGRDKEEARTNYQEFVRKGIGASSPWQKLQGQILLGNEKIIEQMKPLLKETTTIREIPKTQRFANRSPLESLLSMENVHSKRRRNESIRKAYFEHGYKMTEIAKTLRLHYTTISKVVSQKN